MVSASECTHSITFISSHNQWTLKIVDNLEFGRFRMCYNFTDQEPDSLIKGFSQGQIENKNGIRIQGSAYDQY